MATAMKKSPRPSSLATRYRLFDFVRGHGQNRAWRVPNHALRHAPAQGIDDAMLTFGGHDDEIRLLGRLQDHRHDVALATQLLPYPGFTLWSIELRELGAIDVKEHDFYAFIAEGFGSAGR